MTDRTIRDERSADPAFESVRRAVEIAMRDRERADRSARAAWEVEREQVWEKRLTRTKFVAVVAGMIATVIGTAWGVLIWYGDRRQEIIEQKLWRERVDLRSDVIQKSFSEHVVQSDLSHKDIRKTMRDLVDLQLEQAEDQRRILLQALPSNLRRQYEKKSITLREAEKRIREGDHGQTTF